MNETDNKLKERDTILGRVLVRGLGDLQLVPSCPSPEEMAALLDGAVRGDERDTLLGHLAQCKKCREVFVTARQLMKEEAAGGQRRWFAVSSALAAAAVLVVALTLTLGPSPTEQVRVAKQQAPASTTVNAPEQGASKAANSQGQAVAQREAPLPTADRMARMRGQAGDPRRLAALAGNRDKSAEPVMLLTTEEAAMPGSKSFGFAAALRNDGPAIHVEDAEIGADQRSFPLVVGFAPKDGGAVDLASLKLECLKSSPIDLTPRVMPYADKTGVKLESSLLPPGIYRFRVAIGDVNGRLSEKEFTVKVSMTY